MSLPTLNQRQHSMVMGRHCEARRCKEVVAEQANIVEDGLNTSPALIHESQTHPVRRVLQTSAS